MVETAIFVKAELHSRALLQVTAAQAGCSCCEAAFPHAQQDTQVTGFEHTAYMQVVISTCAFHYVELQLPFAAGSQPIFRLKICYTRHGALPK